MNKREFKKRIFALLNEDTPSVTWTERVSLVKKALHDLEQEKEFDTSNEGNPWTDDELRIILKTAPTKENALLLAKAFKRGYGSIEQIFRWAAEDQSAINQKRPDDSSIFRAIAAAALAFANPSPGERASRTKRRVLKQTVRRTQQHKPGQCQSIRLFGGSRHQAMENPVIQNRL